MNRLDRSLKTGTIGELLVQIRFLQYGVQAAPPVRDTGNDLIAVRGQEFRAVQVKTTTRGRFDLRRVPAKYHILICVCLAGKDREVRLDESKIFLLSRADIGKRKSLAGTRLKGKELTRASIERFFSPISR